MADIAVGNSVVLVDDEDLGMVINWRWRIASKPGQKAQYVASSDGTQIHRLIMGLGKGDERQVDHINGDGLDNRRCNLRVATRGENQANRGRNKNNQCGIKGVYWNESRKRWQVTIGCEGKSIFVGRYKTIEEAKEAQELAAQILHGKFARASW